MDSMNCTAFGNGIRGICNTYTEVILVFHNPNRLSLISISISCSFHDFFYLTMLQNYMIEKQRDFKQEIENIGEGIGNSRV